MKMPLSRHSELQIRNRQVKNRIVVPPMASSTATTSGLVTEETLAHYKRLTQSGAGLIIVEYTFVHSSGRSELNQLGISEDTHTVGLAKIAKLIHDMGSLAGIQLSHGGGKSTSELTGAQLMGPSAISVPVKDQQLENPVAMSLADIQMWKVSFIEAAGRAERAGFDLVELHSAHGYGLNQWLSPITNQREDEYGQHLLGRLRLMKEIIAEIRRQYPSLLLSIRMPGQDFLPGGLSMDDTIQIAQELERSGVDLLHVSSGIGGWRRPKERSGEGYLVAEAAQIQASVSIPVIGVGGIETGSYIDESLSQKRFALAAVGRAILSAPQSWRERELSL